MPPPPGFFPPLITLPSAVTFTPLAFISRLRAASMAAALASLSSCGSKRARRVDRRSRRLRVTHSAETESAAERVRAEAEVAGSTMATAPRLRRPRPPGNESA